MPSGTSSGLLMWLMVSRFRSPSSFHALIKLGHTSCVLCPEVMKYNSSINSARQNLALASLWSDGYIAQVLSKRGLSNTTNDLGDILDGLFREYGMPRTLKEVGIEGDEKLREIAKQTLTEAWCQTNPIPITSEAQVLRILHAVQ